MYSKPLSSRMDKPQGAAAQAKRAAAPRAPAGAVNFASFLPQNTTQTPALPSAGDKTGAGSIPQGKTPLEQAATQNNLGLNQMRALSALSVPQTTPGPAEQVTALPTNLGLPLNPQDMYKLLRKAKPQAESAQAGIRAASRRMDNAQREPAAESAAGKFPAARKELRQKSVDPFNMVAAPKSADGKNSTDGNVGRLAARFESGGEGVAAIGYDRHGGTSYGKYQISSRAGTMRNFIGYLKTEAPDIAERLEKAGPMNTWSKRGKMPDAWQQIAAENPDRFERLQEKFIRASHYEPAMRAIAEKSGIPMDNMPLALQEVVFSTAVQHGPHAATRIISSALGQIGEQRLDPASNPPENLAKAQENLIRKIYDNRSGQFRSSAETVQAAVKNRLKQEMSAALSLLHQKNAA
ncbi:hypothetical protein FACS1894206_08940 [Deltaproteobacteria bacterium]|nr:hypothetical protein FACS1894206_08940 [Deltaproteobacteria bacterium]